MSSGAAGLKVQNFFWSSKRKKYFLLKEKNREAASTFHSSKHNKLRQKHSNHSFCKRAIDLCMLRK